MKTNFLLLLAICSLLSSCAGFIGRGAQNLENGEVGKTNKAIDINVKSITNHFGTTKTAELGDKGIRDRIKYTFKSQDAFAKVYIKEDDFSTTDKDADFQLEIITFETVEGTKFDDEIMQVLSGATLFVIPYTQDVAYSIKAKLLDKKGKIVNEYKIESDATYVLQLFMIPFTPFCWPTNVEETIHKNLVTTLFLRVVSDISKA